MKQLFSALLVFAVFVMPSTVLGQKGRQTLSRPVQKSEPAVVMTTPEAFTDGNGVYIRWSTVRETDNLGFNVYRVDDRGKTLVGDKFVPGSAQLYRSETVYGEAYNTFDPDGLPNSQYIVESFERNGTRTSTSPVFPTFVAGLLSVAGETSESLMRRRSEETRTITQTDLGLTKELKAEVEESAQLADPVTQRWVASQPGAKIGVKQTGMYRVLKTQLQAAGFDVGSDPNLWQLYTDGVEQSIIVGPNGDYVDFYGKGIDTTESDTRMYYLVVGPQAGRRMQNVGLRPSFSTVKAASYDQNVLIKERLYYLLDIFNGDTENYFGRLITSSTENLNIDLTAVDPNAYSAQITIRILGYTALPHTVNISLNGHALGQATGTGYGQLFTYTTSVPTSYLVEGQNVLQMIVPNVNDYGFLDYVSISYKRRHVADQNRISFTTQNIRGARLEGFASANIRLFDITRDGDPAILTGAQVTPNASTYDLNVPAYRPRVMYAVEDSGLLAPASVALNTASTLSTIGHNANLVIITHRNFITQANAWADYRRGQGIQVEVVDVEDVYDEFNYGVLSANSLRDFLNYARTNWTTPPQYVLLIGDGSYDPRNYEGTGYWDLIPAKLFDSVYSETASDDAIVDFNNDGLAELAVGRIPARTTAAVTNALNKTMSFEAQAPTANLSRGTLFAYDLPSGYDFQGMCTAIRNQLPAGTPATMIGRGDANSSANLIADMNVGRYTANWCGHGTTGAWASSSFFSNIQVPQLTNINNLTVFTMLTCLNGYFHNINGSALGEVLLNSTIGGSVASWASTGETTPDIQQIMGTRFYHQLGVGSITRLGDLIVDAKTVVPGGRDVRLSWVLLGDPMLKMR